MINAFHRVLRCTLALAPAVLLVSCKSVPMPEVPGIKPYRMTIQQGNFISQEMVAQLKPGMTREQVRFVLGTPLVTDIFHADRWDYVYFLDSAGKKEQRNLSVIFEKDRLARVIGDLMPAEGTGTQAGGFKPQLGAQPESKPAAKPPADAPRAAETPKPAATPAAAAPVSPAEPAKPAAEATKPGDSWEPTKQNWGSAPPEPEKPAAAAEEAKPQEAKAPEENKPEEKGFFTRMREKIGL
jgi:outer membrane protein assembly factor BamE